MPVFISHKKEDAAKANLIYDYLTKRGLTCYLDVIDNLSGKGLSPEALTNHIIHEIRKCTHLLAFVTPITRVSWWVPFEIGTANQMSKKIITANENYSELPEYLKTWPVIEMSDSSKLFYQLDQFIQIYFSDSVVSKSFDPNNPYRDRVITPADFNQSLKAAFGQR